MQAATAAVAGEEEAIDTYMSLTDVPYKTAKAALHMNKHDVDAQQEQSRLRQTAFGHLTAGSGIHLTSDILPHFKTWFAAQKQSTPPLGPQADHQDYQEYETQQDAQQQLSEIRAEIRRLRDDLGGYDGSNPRHVHMGRAWNPTLRARRSFAAYHDLPGLADLSRVRNSAAGIDGWVADYLHRAQMAYARHFGQRVEAVTLHAVETSEMGIEGWFEQSFMMREPM